MTAPLPAPPDRLHELLADRALFGLDAADLGELTQLTAALHVDGIDELDLAAGALAVAWLGADALVQAPESVIRRASAAAGAWDAARAAPSLRLAPAPVPSRRFAAAGWFAAAACLVLALLTRTNRPNASTPAEQGVQVIAQRDDLVRTAPDLVHIPWTATEDPAAAAGVSGEVVWSDARDEGYMHIKGLAANDPNAEQYQLWVFDADRDERYPVDGGVFDIPAGSDEIVIPITAKVPISHATLFAVTVEKPGGVVVSARERIPILAKVDKG